MEELETYECFAVPAHVWSGPESVAPVSPALPARVRRFVPFDMTSLGIEAFPSVNWTESTLNA
jgi:hypothetical protein